MCLACMQTWQELGQVQVDYFIDNTVNQQTPKDSILSWERETIYDI